MTLLQPWFLLLALAVPVALLVRRRRGAPAVRFAPPVDGLPRTWRVRLLLLPPALFLAGILLALVALARPVRRVPLPLLTEGIDIMLCLDTSSSMKGKDMDAQRTRLDIAKEAAARFIAGRPDDRIGVISFARYPDLRCPPTLDHDALQQFLAGVTLVDHDGPEDATGIGTAVARAAQVLHGSGAKSKVVIVLTDGEENVAGAGAPKEIAPLHSGQLCRQLGVRVYAIAAGLGSRNEKAEWVELDTTRMERLASETGGRFFAAREAGAVAAVYGEIDELERIEFSQPRFHREEGFLPFLVVALLLLLASRFLESSVLAVLP